MPSADQVPTKSSHSTMLWHKWVVLIAGSTGSALRAVRPPNLHITPDVRRDLVYAASATGSLYRSPLGHHGPDHPRNLVGERDSRNLGRPPCQQSRDAKMYGTTHPLAHGFAGTAADQGRGYRARQQDRPNGLGHDGKGRAIQGTLRACAMNEIAPDNWRDVKVGRANST